MGAPGSIGLLRPVLHRGRSDWPIVAAAWLLLLCATTLIAASAVYGNAVANGGLRRAVADAPAADRAVVVRSSRPATELVSLDGVVRPAAAAAIAPVGGEVALVAQTGALEPPGAGDEGDERRGSPLAAFEGIERHATLVEGAWAVAGASPVQATLSVGAAEALGLGVGDRTRLVASIGGGLDVELEIVGIWRPDLDDAYWLDSTLALDGTETRGAFTAQGPFVVTREDLVAVAGRTSLDLQWRALPDVDALATSRLADLRAEIGALRGRLAAQLPQSTTFAVEATLSERLDRLTGSLLVSRSGVILLTIQFAALAGYAILLVGGMLIDRRRAETALLRSRGASTGHLVGMAFAEASILALPAVALAPILAVGAVALIGRVGPLADAGIVGAIGITPDAYAAAALAGLGCVLVLTLPSLAAGGPLAGIRAAIARQTGRTLAQRLGLDLVLVVLAGIALWQLRLYGAPLTRQAQGALGVDPLLVAAPAIGLVAGGVLATRVVPRLAELAERLLERRRGLVPPLGARQLARRPLRYTRSAMLLLLAAALGTFAAADAATWGRSQVDRAAYQAAADLRVVRPGSGELPSWAEGAAYRGIDGVEAAVPVLVESFSVGRSIRDGRLLALEPTSAAAVATPLLPGAAESLRRLPELLARLAPARAAPAAIEIPGEPRRVALTIDARLEAAVDEGEAPVLTWPGIGVAVVVQDADGLVRRIAGPRAASQGGEQRIEVPLGGAPGEAALAPAWPLRLVAVELEVRAPDAWWVVGTVELLELATSEAETGDAWRPLPFVADGRAIRWERGDGAQTSPYRPPAGLPGRVVLGPEPDQAGIVYPDSGLPPPILRLEVAAPEDPVPAIVGSRFLEATGTRVGDTLEVTVRARSIPIEILAATELFPPLDPTEPFVVLDAVALEAIRFQAAAFPAEGDEWWLAVAPGRAADVTAAVAGAPFGADGIVGREALAERLTTDPVPLGVIGALGLGAAAAVAFAAIGFVVSAAVSASERIGEFALLQALGLSTRQLAAWLSVENAFLLVFGVLAGTGLGVLLAWLVLPFSTLTETGDRVIPPPVVVVPWEGLAPIYGFAAGLLAVAVLVAVRQLPRLRISSVLRQRDE